LRTDAEHAIEVAWKPFREKHFHALVRMCCRRRSRVCSVSLGTLPRLNETTQWR
jgi:hypothetical protein